MWELTSLIDNAVTGVSKGHDKTLELSGVDLGQTLKVKCLIYK